MKNILRILFITTLFSFFLQSCRDDNDVTWTTKAPSFKLYDTTLGSNVLYPTMENNPFQLVWEKFGTTNKYNVVFSDTSDFAKTITLASTTTNNYKTTIGELNTVLLQAGYSPYASKQMYLRIQTAGTGTDISVSNTIAFTVTPYPVSVPVITSPSSGSSFILDGKNAQGIVTKVVWADYSSYGVDVSYIVEIALSGTNNYTNLGTVDNLKSLDLSNKTLNDAVLKLGLTANVSASVDIRVTATTKSVGGTINKVSQIVKVNVTPFVAFKNMYLVGEATGAGWSTNNNNQALFRDPVNTNKFYFVGYFNSGGFKVIEKLGDNTWQPQWGQKNGVLTVNEGGGQDPDTFNIPTSGYYSFEMDIVAKTYSITPYSGPMTTYTSIDLAGDLNNWSGSTVLTQSSFDPHQWYIKNLVVTTNGGAKFRANGSWGLSWGSDTEFSGIGDTNNGPNIPLNAGTYDVYFNDIDGRYLFVKK